MKPSKPLYNTSPYDKFSVKNNSLLQAGLTLLTGNVSPAFFNKKLF